MGSCDCLALRCIHLLIYDQPGCGGSSQLIFSLHSELKILFSGSNSLSLTIHYV